MIKILAFTTLILVLTSCQNPQSTFDQIILDSGFLPFRNPMSNANVGTIIKGAPSSLFLVAPSARCFPPVVGDHSTELIFTNQTNLPERYQEFIVDFSAQVSSITENGNPTVEFNTTFRKAKTVSIKFENAQIESLDEIAFEDFYLNLMSDNCKKLIYRTPFLVGALRVDKMSYTFKDEVGGSIKLDVNNIDEIVKLHADVKWSIKNNYTLVIETPKYIGYRLAKISEADLGQIKFYAWSLDENGNFDFRKLSRRLFH